MIRIDKIILDCLDGNTVSFIPMTCSENGLAVNKDELEALRTELLHDFVQSVTFQTTELSILDVYALMLSVIK